MWLIHANFSELKAKAFISARGKVVFLDVDFLRIAPQFEISAECLYDVNGIRHTKQMAESGSHLLLQRRGKAP